MTPQVAQALVAAAFLVTMLGATLPTPLYPIYEQELGFGGLMVTVVFATYAVGVLAALLVVGRLSDQLGRKAVLFPGLAVAAASSLVFLIPHSLPALFAGRLLSGVSAGVFTGVATAAIIDLAPVTGRARAGLLAASVNVLGLGLGPVVAGVLADHAPHPLVLPYLLHVALVAVAAVGLAAVPEPVERRPGRVRLQIQRVGVPDDVRPTFVRAAVSGFAGFAVLGFFTAVSPLFLGQVLHETRHLLTGLMVFALLGSATVGQVASARLPERTSLLGGCLALAAGTVVVAVGFDDGAAARGADRGGRGRARAGGELPRRPPGGDRRGTRRPAQRGVVELLHRPLRRDLDPRDRRGRRCAGVRPGADGGGVRGDRRAAGGGGVREPAAPPRLSLARM